MRHTRLATALLLAAAPAMAEEDFWRYSVQGCFIGGGVMGTATALVLYPAAASGTVTLPATTLVIGNTLFGCGLGTVGAMAAYGLGSIRYYLLGAPSPGTP